MQDAQVDATLTQPHSPISFVIPLKNRTRFFVKHNGQQVELRLFENNLKRLAHVFNAEVDTWEIVVVDYRSTDVRDLPKMIETIFSKEVKITYVRVEEPCFNRGQARNIGRLNAEHNVIFFLDADMEIRTRHLHPRTCCPQQKNTLSNLLFVQKPKSHNRV